MKTIESFLTYQKEIAKYEYLSNILAWDLRVNSPKDGKSYLIDILSQMELKAFELSTSEEYGKILKDVLQSNDFSSLKKIEQRFIQNLKEKYDLNKKVPASFYQEYTKLKSLANTAWEEAKAKNNYSLFKPYLQKIIEMTKEYYTHLYPNTDIYDAMLSSHEKGMTSKEIDPLFQQIKEELIPLVQKYQGKKARTLSKITYSESELKDCANYLLNYIGFDCNRGTVGIYPHGFTTKIHADDVRIAFDQSNNPCFFVSTIIHEGGHGIFEQNFSPDIRNLRNQGGEDIYGLHESQSRFYENILGKNKNFWTPIYQDIQKMLKLEIPLEEFVQYLNQVTCGSIRTEADELTYCLHIIIRYEIEKAIFRDNIGVDELPSLWNQKTKEYLGVEVTSDKEGILQDVHWSEGSFGYFPSYLLGNIYDGMFLEAIEKQIGSIDTLLEKKEIKKITDFLIQKIYQFGDTLSAKEVVQKICHKEISAEPIIRYYKKKYEKSV